MDNVQKVVIVIYVLLRATIFVTWSWLVLNNRIHPPGLHIITDSDLRPEASYNLNIPMKMGNAQPDISVIVFTKFRRTEYYLVT